MTYTHLHMYLRHTHTHIYIYTYVHRKREICMHSSLSLSLYTCRGRCIHTSFFGESLYICTCAYVSVCFSHSIRAHTCMQERARLYMETALRFQLKNNLGLRASSASGVQLWPPNVEHGVGLEGVSFCRGASSAANP